MQDHSVGKLLGIEMKNRMFFSKSTCGFYSEEHHKGKIPNDATEEKDWSMSHEELIKKASEGCGLIITGDEHGFPVLTQAPVFLLTEKEVHVMRKSAYTLESDPLKIEVEYDALVSGTSPDYSKWLLKVAEIKEKFPLPGEV